ncbi:MAG TPA: alpha/beta hydrolase [Planctomycetota bacterium]|jgi:pimeloyl-ACP methyl ester carboxylesterase|nr:alpha/beta hydrolase [Planctomycetota bacterium]
MLAAALAVLGALGVPEPRPATRPTQEDPAPPGRLVDVDGRRMHLHALGEGSPVVVFEAGAGACSLDWALVQPEVARFTATCSYDRAGFAWSEPGPTPRTGERISEELHALLRAAAVSPPYVLVGHSFGGIYVRIFREEFPAEVVGMVLVDSSHEDMQMLVGRMGGKVHLVRPRGYSDAEWERLFEPDPDEGKGPESARAAPAPETRNAFPDPEEKLPPEVRRLRAWARSRPGYRNVDFDTREQMRVDLGRVFESRGGRSHPLGDLPLVILTRGGRKDPPDPDVTPEQARALDLDRERLQQDLAGLSRIGRQVRAEASGHEIHWDEPDLVIRSVREVVEEARRRAREGRR